MLVTPEAVEVFGDGAVGFAFVVGVEVVGGAVDAPLGLVLFCGVHPADRKVTITPSKAKYLICLDLVKSHRSGPQGALAIEMPNVST